MLFMIWPMGFTAAYRYAALGFLLSEGGKYGWLDYQQISKEDLIQKNDAVLVMFSVIRVMSTTDPSRLSATATF